MWPGTDQLNTRFSKASTISYHVDNIFFSIPITHSFKELYSIQGGAVLAPILSDDITTETEVFFWHRSRASVVNISSSVPTQFLNKFFPKFGANSTVKKGIDVVVKATEK